MIDNYKPNNDPYKILTVLAEEKVTKFIPSFDSTSMMIENYKFPKIDTVTLEIFHSLQPINRSQLSCSSYNINHRTIDLNKLLSDNKEAIENGDINVAAEKRTIRNNKILSLALCAATVTICATSIILAVALNPIFILGMIASILPSTVAFLKKPICTYYDYLPYGGVTRREIPNSLFPILTEAIFLYDSWTRHPKELSSKDARDQANKAIEAAIAELQKIDHSYVEITASLANKIKSIEEDQKLTTNEKETKILLYDNQIDELKKLNNFLYDYNYYLNVSTRTL